MHAKYLSLDFYFWLILFLNPDPTFRAGQYQTGSWRTGGWTGGYTDSTAMDLNPFKDSEPNESPPANELVNRPAIGNTLLQALSTMELETEEDASRVQPHFIRSLVAWHTDDPNVACVVQLTIFVL